MVSIAEHRPEFLSVPLASEERVDGGLNYDVVRLAYCADREQLAHPRTWQQIQVEIWNWVMSSKDEPQELLRERLGQIKDYLRARVVLSHRELFFTGSVLRHVGFGPLDDPS